jgi:hypothetical protein
VNCDACGHDVEAHADGVGRCCEWDCECQRFVSLGSQMREMLAAHPEIDEAAAAAPDNVIGEYLRRVTPRTYRDVMLVANFDDKREAHIASRWDVFALTGLYVQIAFEPPLSWLERLVLAIARVRWWFGVLRRWTSAIAHRVVLGRRFRDALLTLSVDDLAVLLVPFASIWWGGDAGALHVEPRYIVPRASSMRLRVLGDARGFRYSVHVRGMVADDPPLGRVPPPFQHDV